MFQYLVLHNLFLGMIQTVVKQENKRGAKKKYCSFFVCMIKTVHFLVLFYSSAELGTRKLFYWMDGKRDT